MLCRNRDLGRYQLSKSSIYMSLSIMPSELRESWLEFYVLALRRTFEPQEDKVLKIFNTCNGWEVWAQVELALALKHSLPDWVLDMRTVARRGAQKKKRLLQEFESQSKSALEADQDDWEDLFDTESSTLAQDVPDRRSGLYKFKREKQVYKGNKKRCDFAIEILMQSGQRHCHFFELKCLAKGQLRRFIKGVHEDQEKVKREKPDPKWTRGAAVVSGYVMAIAVVPLGDRGNLQKLFDEFGHGGICVSRPVPNFDRVVKIGKQIWVWIEERPRYGIYSC